VVFTNVVTTPVGQWRKAIMQVITPSSGPTSEPANTTSIARPC